jgi:hypothetical protein
MLDDGFQKLVFGRSVNEGDGFIPKFGKYFFGVGIIGIVAEGYIYFCSAL